LLEYFENIFGQEMNSSVLKRLGCTMRAYLLEFQDDEDIEKMVNEQVQLLNGNRDLFIMIDNNMKNGDLDKFFIKEHNIIFSWRETFFNHHFPNGSWFTVDSVPFDPEDEYLRFITISFQITKYFDRVMALASAKGRALIPWVKQLTYFENDELLASVAESKYKSGALIDYLSNGHDEDKLAVCVDFKVGFGEVFHIIAEAFKTGPKKLEEIALKAVMVNHIKSDFIPLSDVPAIIQRKSVHGMYALGDDAPDNISSEGKELFETMKRIFALTL